MRTLAALILCSSTAYAACVNGYPTIREEYNSSALVFVGDVVAHRSTPSTGDGYFLDGDSYMVTPLAVLKGRPGSKVNLFSENSSGRFPMLLERKYLLFVYEDHGRLMVDNCGNSDVMPHAKNALAQVTALAAHGYDPRAALNSLHSARPAVRWNASSVKVADFDCDGKTDAAMLGSEKGRAVVGVVWGAPAKRPLILTPSTQTPKQGGVNEQPETIDTFSLDCKDEDGRALAGCKTVPACRAFAVHANDATFVFYWDSSKGRLNSWRLPLSSHQ
ncbi:MAG TPA: hypothetical protein VMD29_05180 [Terracidiphilus sp.]|nr:hypothetical protein [Terracidiphilus sp.]